MRKPRAPVPFDPGPLLGPAAAAVLLGVDPRTVRRWANAGRFPDGAVIRTPGGQRKYKEAAVLAMRDGTPS